VRVLITGATGFAGRHLTTLAAGRGAEVVGIGRQDAKDCAPPEALAEYVVADLTDRRQTAATVRSFTPDRVFHLAADASVGASWRVPERTLDNNLRSTFNVLDSVLREAPDARLLVACSGEEYGPVPAERLPVTEQEPLRPRSPYAASKACADVLAGFYADAHGLHVVRTRAFNHAGPGQTADYVVSALARQIALAEGGAGPPADRVELTTGDLTVRRDFTDVRDVVRAYWLALERCEPEAYNVCRGESIPLTDILAALVRGTPLHVDRSTDPDRIRPDDVPETRGAAEKLRLETGWTPEIPLERTVSDTLGWWRERVRDSA